MGYISFSLYPKIKFPVLRKSLIGLAQVVQLLQNLLTTNDYFLTQNFSQHASHYWAVPEGYNTRFDDIDSHQVCACDFLLSKLLTNFSNSSPKSTLIFLLLATVLWDHSDEGWNWQASGQYEEVHWWGLDHLDPEWPEQPWGSAGILP